MNGGATPSLNRSSEVWGLSEQARELFKPKKCLSRYRRFAGRESWLHSKTSTVPPENIILIQSAAWTRALPSFAHIKAGSAIGGVARASLMCMHHKYVRRTIVFDIYQGCFHPFFLRT